MIHLLLTLLLAQREVVSHTFHYRTDRTFKSVSLAGTFNNWDKRATPMNRSNDGYTVTLKLPLGKHLYKFVLDDNEWIVDPKATKNEDDGNGNINSVLFLLPAEYEKPAVRGDGVITEVAIRHSQTVPELNYDRGQITLRLEVRANDVSQVQLLTGGRATPMRRLGGDDLHENYEISVPWNRKSDLTYSFIVRDKDKTLTVGADGLTGDHKPFRIDARTFRPFEVPSWVEGTVFYQIFPDRFENGDKNNDPKAVVSWDSKPTYYNRFGGDAAGIRKRIGHLKSLGVKGVYLNPIMEAPANHRYDPANFYKVDPEFGTNEEFSSLTKDLKKAGIRTVLDQIFDHVGVTFPPFADLLKNQQNSPYRHWFFVKEWPVEVRQNPPYEAWWGFESMPKINLANPDARKHLLDSVDFWHERADLAGWRLDVANEAPQWFWREFRTRVKGIDPNAWIVGEVWTNAAEWLRGDQWDASMNYPFRGVVLSHIAHGRSTASQFMKGLMQVYSWLAPQVSRNQLNLLSSHDTPRFITECNGDRRLAKLGAVVQMTWVGAPSIYYGEEIGMEGGADPANRAGMRWELVHDGNDMLQHYRRLIAVRNSSRALQSGDPVVLLVDDSKNVSVYARVVRDDVAVVAINRSRDAQDVKVQLPAVGRGKSFVDGLTGKAIESSRQALSIEIPPLGAIVGIPKERTSTLRP